MIERQPDPAPSDAELVAYLDGELSPSESVRVGQLIAGDLRLAERVATLMRGARPFREAFEPLLGQAPMDRLDTMLSAALLRAPKPSRRFRLGLPRSWAAAAVAAAALILIGAGLDRLLDDAAGSASFSNNAVAEAAEWRQAVAQYLSLYTSVTLSIIPDSDANVGRALASVGSGLGIDLTPALVQLPDLALRRAELLDYDGKGLGFLAYLDPRSGPIALCIIAGSHGDALPRVEHRQGMDVVYWSAADHGFMLIGRPGIVRLQALATLVAERFGASGGDKAVRDRG